MSRSGARRVCLVSGGHPSSNPRLVKEADSLVAAGYDVTVVHAQTWRPGLEHDRALLSRRAWRVLTAWDGPGPMGYTVRRGVQRALRALARVLPVQALGRALTPVFPPLRRRALSVKAELYIGHTLVALPVVVACARAHGTKYAFDVEDFHPGERDGSRPGDLDWSIADRLLAAHLPGAAYITAASPLIAEEVTRRYGVRTETVLNVFDPDEGGPPPPVRAVPTFYWFSQTVGPGRGLEAMIEILGALARPVTLELRGACDPAYRASLEALAAGAGGGWLSLVFLPTAPPDEMVRLARGYTAGLSTEQPTCLNREICLTNKIFTYIAAGTPVMLTPTRAQSEMARGLGGVACLVRPEDPQAPGRLQEWMQAGVAHVGHDIQERYSWLRAQVAWLERVEEAIGRPPSRLLAKSRIPSD